MINVRTLLYGLAFGLIDVVSLPAIKKVSIGWNPLLMLIPLVLYAASPFVFLKGLLGGETLTILNLVWDLTSDVLITLIGLFYFQEHVPPTKLVGVIFSFLALFLMTYEGDGWNDWLASNFSKAKRSFLG